MWVEYNFNTENWESFVMAYIQIGSIITHSLLRINEKLELIPHGLVSF